MSLAIQSYQIYYFDTMEFENLIRSNDVVCFVETKTDMFDSIDLPGYVFKSKHRKNVDRMRSGGILLGFRDDDKCLDESNVLLQ
jgi:hypothetical protein